MSVRVSRARAAVATGPQLGGVIRIVEPFRFRLMRDTLAPAEG